MALSEYFYFSVPKRVMINNSRVGFLRYFLVLPIIMYLIYFVMVDGRNYQISEKPDGAVWGTLTQQVLTMNTATESFVYCDAYSGTETSLYPKKCEVYDPSDVYSEEVNGGFIATSFQQVEQTYSCSDAAMQAGTCTQPWVNGASKTTYVTNVEGFELNLNHYGQATRHLRLSKDDKLYAPSSYATNGKLVDGSGNIIEQYSSDGLADRITIGSLLQAAGVTLDSACDSVYCPISASKRGTGLVLFVTIEYGNLDNMSEAPSYEIHVRAIENSVYTKTNVQYSADGTTRVLYTHSGLRLVFITTGLVGRFDFPLMLTYAASTLFFFFVISYLVDFLLLCALPNRRIYRNLIYEEPVNPDMVEEKVKQIKSHKMYRVLDTDAATTVATHLVRCENENLIRPDKPQLFPLTREMEHDVNLNRAAAEEVLLGMLTCETDPAKQVLSLTDIDYLFRGADKDQNRVLTHEEVMSAFASMGVQADPARILKVMLAYDPQEEPVLTKENFQSLMQGSPLGFEARCKIVMDHFHREQFWSSKVEQRNLDGDFMKLSRENDSLPTITRDQFQVYLRQERKFELTAAQFDALWIVADKEGRGGINAAEFTYWTHFMDIYTYNLTLSKARATKEEAMKLNKSRSAVSVGAGSGAAGSPSGGATAAGGAAAGAGFNMAGTGMVTKNQLNQINWATAKSQFRQIATHVNALHEKYIELARITRLLQLKYLPHTITDGQPEDFEPITLEGDWRGEKAAECQLN